MARQRKQPRQRQAQRQHLCLLVALPELLRPSCTPRCAVRVLCASPGPAGLTGTLGAGSHQQQSGRSQDRSLPWGSSQLPRPAAQGSFEFSTCGSLHSEPSVVSPPAHIVKPSRGKSAPVRSHRACLQASKGCCQLLLENSGATPAWSMASATAFTASLQRYAWTPPSSQAATRLVQFAAKPFSASALQKLSSWVGCALDLCVCSRRRTRRLQCRQ